MHLTENDRTLLIESHVLLYFFVMQSLHLLIYLIECPNLLLKLYSTFHVVSSLTYLLYPPRIFGSTCFVHNLAQGREKLPPRALKCVFIDTLDFKNCIISIHLIYVDILYLLMSHSMNLNLIIHLVIISRSYLYIKPYSYLLLRKSTISSISPVIVPPFLTYHHGQHITIFTYVTYKRMVYFHTLYLSQLRYI